MADSPYTPIEVKEFNPADLENLVRFCVRELQSRRVFELPPPSPFVGAGIYALYYDGEYPLYQHLSIRSTERTQPICVGRARLTNSSGTRPLFNRLREHARSIDAAENLRVEDFTCRFLVLHPVWVSTVEDILINYFDTLWNGVVKGFGVHDPGGKRHGGELPLWDALHPGRSHARSMLEKGAKEPLPGMIAESIAAFTSRRGGLRGAHGLDQDRVDQLLRHMVSEDDEA